MLDNQKVNLFARLYQHDTDKDGEQTNIRLLLGRLNYIFKNPEDGISRQLWETLASENPPYDVEYA